MEDWQKPPDLKLLWNAFVRAPICALKEKRENAILLLGHLSLLSRSKVTLASYAHSAPLRPLSSNQTSGRTDIRHLLKHSDALMYTAGNAEQRARDPLLQRSREFRGAKTAQAVIHRTCN